LAQHQRHQEEFVRCCEERDLPGSSLYENQLREIADNTYLVLTLHLICLSPKSAVPDAELVDVDGPEGISSPAVFSIFLKDPLKKQLSSFSGPERHGLYGYFVFNLIGARTKSCIIFDRDCF